MSIVVPVLAALFLGYSVGVTREWHRVLAYLDANENESLWWVSTGIAADLHHTKAWNRQAAGACCPQVAKTGVCYCQEDDRG